MRKLLALHFSAAMFDLASSTSSTGSTGCPCMEYANMAAYRGSDGKLKYSPSGDQGPSYQYPPNYGNTACLAHDDGLPPLCDDTTVPGWCKAKWCWVDKAACSGVKYMRTTFFPAEENLYYSYETCSGPGGQNTFANWIASGGGGNDAVLNLIGLVDQNLRTSRASIETAYVPLAGGGAAVACETTPLCMCPSCQLNSKWGKKVDFSEVGTLMPTQDADISQKDRNTVSCLASSISSTYRKVAATESDAQGSRIGYQYFADQISGSFVQWPALDWCPRQENDKWDPRFRPWYAAGATGPKDVVLVVDVSGSMATAGRHRLAADATIAVLDTLTWRDFGDIVLFDSSVKAVFSGTTVPVTESKRDEMKSWVRSEVGHFGGTNFREGMTKALDIIESSVSAGSSAMCQKAILFLTDGTASFSESDYSMVRTKAKANGVIVFSYALGTGANTDVTKRLACENNGIFYQVPDSGDLGKIMSQYYSYFAAGTVACTPTWVKYEDQVSHTQLYAGCLAMYDRTKPNAELLGTTCMDANMVVTEQTLRDNSESWDKFICKISDLSKTCRPTYLSECHKEDLRRMYSPESVCAALSPEVPEGKIGGHCPCVDSSCDDDPLWVDEKGYFCDTWVGDDCNSDQLRETWDYSVEGWNAIKQKCQRSCGLCPYLPTCPTAPPTCPEERATPDKCRCELGKVSGLDIEGDVPCENWMTAMGAWFWVVFVVLPILACCGGAFVAYKLIGNRRKKRAARQLSDQEETSSEEDEDGTTELIEAGKR